MGRFKGVTPRLLPMLLHPDRLEDEHLTRIVMDMAERVGQAAFIRQQTAILGRPDSRAGLPSIACPTLVLCGRQDAITPLRSEEHTSELQSLMRNSYAVFCLKKKKKLNPLTESSHANHLKARLRD